MSIHHLTDTEIALRLAQAIRAWRMAPAGAGMTQAALARKSGIGLTPFKRFEKTGATTLGNLIALLRALDLLDGLENIIPDATAPGPLQLLEEDRKKIQRKRAPRTDKGRG